MKLNTIRHGAPTEAAPVLIAHGLFGSGRNWGVIAKRLADRGEVIAVDMRNHGQSPWSEEHGYPDLAGDLAEVIDTLDAPADVVGHSMGGKAAMALALAHPEKVRRLVVADIAPVAYGHSQMEFIEAMRGVDLSKVEKRSDAAEQLKQTVPDKTLQSFFTQSLDASEKKWLLNLDVLADQMPKILGWPQIGGTFERPALFLSGEESDYVAPEHRGAIRELFPKARFAKLPGAGHWLHAEKPREFEASVRAFLDAG
ncbi:esterase [Roseivivax halodurans JCM 10272]|uniref:Esterase n=1 Tax=Roseivivax halodurans JCM 10272 TaxID=1449350 RepID=X7ED94_9RHOB|nr:alpha/beta fold hydrolase [Roseivivax halodurans]ETX14054.1 esterase [Roseivivax halodurans JCM 10272]